MGIQMIGIDHNRAVLDVRMIFSFTKKDAGAAVEALKQVPGIEGCVLLSTCNRMELWASTDDTFSGSLFEWLCRHREVSPQKYEEYFISRRDREAVHHLFRLAGGLESKILGEDQIVTQVGDALALAREHYAADHVLETLFRQAVTAAKKVKTNVALSPSDTSVVRTAIQTLRQKGMEFQGKKCLVIGNGVMGKLAATQLREQGADVTVTVRQYRSGIVEIPRDCSRIDYGKRMELFSASDYVVSATVSPNYTLTRELIEPRLNGPVTLIDLAVPRDIDPKAAGLAGVTLYDIDCFQEEARSEEQKKAIQEAEKIFEEQMEEFYVWYECRDMIPKIQEIKEKAALDLGLRLQRKVRSLPVTQGEQEKLQDEIQSAAVRAVNKMLFGLRDNMGAGTFRECLDALEQVYGDSQIIKT